MAQNFVFSWAENADGRMVHVDDVPQGLECNCICPHCHEKLIARHGDVREHGFAHHSETRGANLNICYMVVMYKLAEQLVKVQKRIHAPSYYGIYKEQDIEFADIKIDCQYEREDKQPDVIATTTDGKQYLIEFYFKYKAQHKKAIDYKNLSCLEIDLSNQTLNSLKEFILCSTEEEHKYKKWLNNENYFNCIEEKYHKAGKEIKIVPESKCKHCDIYYNCCAVRKDNSILTIENSGEEYRLCKIELYKQEKEKHKLRIEEEEKKRQQKQQELQRWQNEWDQKQIKRRHNENTQTNPEDRICFNCKSNLSWAKGNRLARCGCYISLGLSGAYVDPEYAKQCQRFTLKSRTKT